MALVTHTVSSIRWFEEIGIEDVPLVGGKNASLGEMYRELASQGVKVPNGFAITADAYRSFLRAAKLDRTIEEILQRLNTQDVENLRQRGRHVRDAILAATLPADLQQAITEAYDRLSDGSHDLVDVAVRSSATAEDLLWLETDVEREPMERGQTETIVRLLDRLDERAKREIEAIDLALTRIEAGSYGRCDGCGKAIPEARLRAMPTATTCLVCGEAGEAVKR